MLVHLYYFNCRYYMLRRVRTRRQKIARSRQLVFCSIKVMTSYKYTIVRRRTVSRAIKRCGIWSIRRQHLNAEVSPSFSY